MFILNINNHEIYDNFDDFRANFIKSNEKEYKELVSNFKSPFNSIVNEINWSEIEDNRDFLVSISSKNSKNDVANIALNRRDDDVLGKAYDKNGYNYASYY